MDVSCTSAQQKPVSGLTRKPCTPDAPPQRVASRPKEETGKKKGSGESADPRIVQKKAPVASANSLSCGSVDHHQGLGSNGQLAGDELRDKPNRPAPASCCKPSGPASEAGKKKHQAVHH